MTQDVKVKAPNYTGYEQRTAIPTNVLGISGVDHVGLATRDPLAGGAFVEQILGGVQLIKAGFDEEDRKLGRPMHIFYLVGSTVVEVAVQKDEDAYPKIDDRNDQPHFSFGTTAEGLVKFADHLRKHNVPFNGPRSHRGMSAVSVYFRDPDGNNLEVTTWEEVPEGVATPMGGPNGFVEWPKLAHAWKPAG